jgi:20S proteasome subunit beta 3
MSSILQYNGASIIAMAGDKCVAIAADKRYGIRNQTVGANMRKCYAPNDKTLVGLAGLATDMQTLESKFAFRHNMYRLREERPMRPKTYANMVSSLLYETRFGPYFCEPIVAGLDGENGDEPFLCGMDLLGAQVLTDDFMVSGDCTEALYGLCESLYRPKLGPDELFETVAQCLLSGVDRDCLSGWGGVVLVLTPDGLITRDLKGRMD